MKDNNIIISINGDAKQLDTLDEVISYVFGDEYKNLNQKQKINKRYDIAMPYAIKNKIHIVYSEKGVINYDKIFEKNTKYDIENSIIIDNEITLILSLCNLDVIRILEKKGANIFIHEEINNNKDANYVFVNKYATKLIEKYLKKENIYV